MSLTDKSFNETYRQSLSSNDLYNIELAINFIKQSSFYNTSLDNTNAFNPDKKQYEDRCVYLDSFTNNREFYDKNLKVDTKLSNDIANFTTGFAKGGINLVKDTITGVYYLVSNPVKTGDTILRNTPDIISALPSAIKNGLDKGELDIVLGDYESVTARDLEFIAGLTGPSAITNKAVKTAWDRVGDIALKPIDDIVDSFSKYHINNTLSGLDDFSKNIPNIGNIPNIELAQNINKAVQDIIKEPIKTNTQLKKHNGSIYNNYENLLPSISNGKEIQYREYRVEPVDKAKNVHRIVVGSDGTYYYSNNHYGQNGNGIPFYRVGVLPKETINKMFGGIK